MDPEKLRINVLIADDAEDVRLLLKLALNRRAVFSIVGEAKDGREAVALTSQLGPDVVILDLSMPVMDGLQAAAEIKERRPSTKIIVYSGFRASDVAGKAMAAGANLYLEKTENLSELESAVIGVYLDHSAPQ